MKKHIISILILFACILTMQAQFKWENPLQQSFPVVKGRAWHNELKDSYNRLPERAKEKVRAPLWNLACQSAGLSVSFYSNASEIKVKYVLKGAHSMPHMPATGVSGVDLYATDSHGKQRWCGARYNFGDTITYTYSNLSYETPHNRGYEYQLFLPLYNSVSWLEIGVAHEAQFSFIPVSEEKPLVIYGTSIAQGACASRPGMAWTNIVGRNLESPVINMGFSGNGKLEAELFQLLAEIDAKLYIIDCMPNLSGEEAAKQIYNQTLQGVNILREKSNAPILLVEHGGYTNALTSKTRETSYNVANVELRKAYEAIKNNGIPEVYYLSKEEIGLSLDATVEGVHPTDLGMQQYADSYIRKINEILSRESGKISTLAPCKQRREPDMYEWNERHEQILKQNKEQAPEVVMIGNSITHYWAGEPIAPKQSGVKSWNKLFKGKKVRNLGFGWDRIENVLWRIHHGELDGYQAENIFLMIGTNNLGINSDEEIITGIQHVIQAIRQRQPTAKLCVAAILPRKGMESRIANLNENLRTRLSATDVSYMDLTDCLTNNDGVINHSLFSDGLHPNEKGYEYIAKELKKHLTKTL
ncbi:MAG: SGNH/GDSL hydrolase family protein [Bacteroidales bacterium]